ncbi:MAG: c-type cytochrome [Saprospiraceae bacterium]
MFFLLLPFSAGVLAVANRLGYYLSRLAADPESQDRIRRQIVHLQRLRVSVYVLIVVLMGGSACVWALQRREARMALEKTRAALRAAYNKDQLWESPDWALAQQEYNAKLLAYGRDLIAHTNDSFGENGLVRPSSINGLNCQNCHLDAGARPYGNNYAAVASTYPQMRSRSGTLETIPKRVNDCFERSLNGQPLNPAGREMKAIVAYIEWLGMAVPKGEKPKGVGLNDLPYLDRAADPEKGKRVFEQKCGSCHGADGQGLPMPGSERRYPPLWGPNSYNEAAGLFRLSRFAGYVKDNMPLGASHDSPQLSDEEAWDVAAFVNSQPRPKHPFLETDWPDIAKKPVDHPFGPFKDTFPEAQHKYGPFGPIAAYYKK